MKRQELEEAVKEAQETLNIDPGCHVCGCDTEWLEPLLDLARKVLEAETVSLHTVPIMVDRAPQRLIYSPLED